MRGLSTTHKLAVGSLLLLTVVMVSHPVAALAQASSINDGLDQAKGVASESGLSTQEFKDFLLSVLNYGLGFLSILAMAAVIYAGSIYITSAGEEKKAERAKQIVLYAIIGLVIVGFAAVIVNTVIFVALYGKTTP